MSDGNGQGRAGKPAATGPGSSGLDDSWFIDAQRRKPAADSTAPGQWGADLPATNPGVKPPDPQPDGGSEAVADAGVDVDESPMKDEDVTSGVSTLQRVARPPAAPVAAPLPPLQQGAVPSEPAPADIEQAKATVEHCEREAKAFGKTPAAAPLWFEAGRLYEQVLRNSRQAASCYQAAFTADAGYVPVIHAARRLFSEIGNWGMAVLLLNAEIKAVADPARRAALAVQRGEILESKLAKESEAEQSYREALELAPDYGPAFDALARRMLSQKRYSEYAALAQRVIESLPPGDQHDQRTLSAARVLETYLDEYDRALELLERVLQKTPGHLGAAVARVRILTRLKRDAELVDALEHLARIEAGERRAAVLIEAARLCRSRLNDAARARALLERAKVAAPTNMLVLRDLGDILAVGGHYEALTDVLLEQASHITDYRERVAVHAELGRIFEEKLHSEEKAIEQYQKVVEFDSTYQPALVSLGRLYYRHGRFEDLVRLYEEEIAQIEEESQKVPRLFKVAELLQNQLGNVDKALAYYQAVLAIDARYIPAQKALGSLLLAAGRWNDLIQIYEHELALTQDRDQSIFLLDKIGTLWDEKLNDVDRAIDAFERMLAMAPGYLPAIRNLGKLYARAKRFRELIRISEQEAQALQDPMQVVALLYRTGEIYEINLADKDKAIEVYRKVVGLNPTYLPALKSLGRLYHERGMYDDLIDMHRQEAEVCRDAGQRASLLFKIGEVYQEQLGNQDEAIRSYRSVLQDVPNHHPTLRALSRIALTRGDDFGLAEVAKLECAVLNNPRERAIARCRAALVEEIHLGQDQAARQSYQGALDDNPALLEAQSALTRIALRSRDPDAEIAALRDIAQHATQPGDQLALALQLADRLAYGVGRLAEALTAYQDVLARAPDEAQALRGALFCALGQHDYRLAISFGERLAALEPEPRAAASLHLQIAGWRSAHIDPPEDPTPNYLKALEYSPSDPVALRAVETAYTRSGNAAGLYALYQRERETIDQPAHRQFLTLRMAELAAGPLQLGEEHLALLEEAVAIDPKSTIALRRLKQAYASTDRVTDQLRVLALEADASPDPQAAIGNLLEVGRLQEERANNLEAAADCFLKVLRRDSANEEAFSRAERLLGMLEKFGELALLYHGRSSVVADVDSKVGLLMRAAQLEANQVNNPISALATFREVLHLNPRYVPALIGAGDLELNLGHHAEAAELYSQVSGATQDPTVLAPIQRRLGDIYRVHLPDPPRAIQAYVASLSFQPNNIEV
ncbi:MAG: tetratricopeptide repeat protein, partial [Deltaproteobacteria bacterium]|nr:tetratricopeptide repeat protein [Deltaproteobacteria bacterium]